MKYIRNVLINGRLLENSRILYWDLLELYKKYTRNVVINRRLLENSKIIYWDLLEIYKKCINKCKIIGKIKNIITRFTYIR